MLYLTENQDCVESYPRNWTGMYHGRMNTTITGETCAMWNTTKHHNYGQLNYCRAPAGDSDSHKGPWCYINYDSWDFCYVPLCSEYIECVNAPNGICVLVYGCFPYV